MLFWHSNYFSRVCSANHLITWNLSDVSFHKRFNLIASVNHSETLEKVHYNAYVTLPKSLSWQFCNDTAVLWPSVEKVNNTPFYIYIYKFTLGLEYLSLLVGVTALLIRASHPVLYLIFCTVRELGCLFLTLGVTTLHIVPVTLLYMVTMLLD